MPLSILVSFLIPVIVCVTTRSADAKELSAACPSLARLVEETQTALKIAGRQRDRGSALGAYQILRATMTNLTAQARDADCGSSVALLDRTLTRAERSPDAVEAALTLDLGFAAFLSLAVLGTVASDDLTAKRMDMKESAHYASECPDLFALVQRLDQHRGDAAGAAATLLAELRARPRCPDVVRLLAGTPPDRLAFSIDSVILDEPSAAGQDREVWQRCPEYAVVVDRLRAAIEIGVPLYNNGDHERCRAAYERTARSLLDGKDNIGPGRCPAVRNALQHGLTEAAHGGTPGDAAWALRRAFDEVLGNPAEAPPPTREPAKRVDRSGRPPSPHWTRGAAVRDARGPISLLRQARPTRDP